MKLTNKDIDRYFKNPVLFLKEQYFLASGKLTLMPKQEAFLTKLFLTKRRNGTRKYNLSIFSTPKKNGKSETGSMLATIFAFLEEPGGEIIFAACDLEQASLIMFKRFKEAIARNPILKSSVKIYRDAVEVTATGTVARVISSDAPSAHGFNANLILFDELWTFKNRDFYDALTESPIRAQPLTAIFTYAGHDQTSLLYSLYETGIEKSDKNMLFFWTEKNLAPWISKTYLDQQRRRLPPNVYQRLHQNRWSQGEASFLTLADVEQCIDKDLCSKSYGAPGESYVLAIDLGLKKDRTCGTIIHKNHDSGKLVLDQIRVWKGSRENPVVISSIEEYIEESYQRFNITQTTCDPWQAMGLIQKFKQKGYNFNEFVFSGSNLTKLSQHLYFLIHNGLLVLFPDKGLKEELLQANSVEKSYGFRIDHESGRFNDRVISLGMACLSTLEEVKPLKNIAPATFLSAKRQGSYRKEAPTYPGNRPGSRFNV